MNVSCAALLTLRYLGETRAVTKHDEGPGSGSGAF